LKLKILREEDNKIEIAFGGEGHTFLNLIQSSLLKNKNVTMAGYSKVHPLMNRSILQIYMKKGKNYKKTMLEAAKDAKDKMNEFVTKFNKELKKKSIN
jgi:DNA-directed RNA polymerase subunit L